MVVALCFSSKKNVGVEYIIYDVDSTIRAQLHHSANNKIGNISENIIEPLFLVDLSHRIKVMCKEVFNLSLASKQSSYYELIDVLRFKN